MNYKRHASPSRLVQLFDVACFLGGLGLLASALGSAIVEARSDELSIWLLAANAFACLFGVLLTSMRSYPLLLTGFFFGFIFFGIAPLQQLSVGYDPIFGLVNVLQEGVLLCIACTGSLWICVAYRGSRIETGRRNFMSAPLGGHNFNPTFLAATSAVVIAAMLAAYGPYLLTSREVLSLFYNGLGNRSLELALRYFFTPFVVLAPVLGYLVAKSNRSSYLMTIFAGLAILGFLINNPFITARYRASTLLVFALMAYFGWNSARLLLGALVAGTFISPVLNTFRYERGGADTRDFGTFFAHMDYDCLTILCHTIRYVGEQGISYGYNLLSAFLFFIPRNLWESKGENISKTMFDYLSVYRKFGTDNLSSPLPAEGFYAFGLIGALLVPLAFFWAMTFIERRATGGASLSPWHLIAAVTPMIMIISQRGPFLIGYSELFGHVAALLLSIGLLRLGSPRRASIAERTFTSAKSAKKSF